MNQELVDYIKQQINLNVSKNKITDILLGQGWQQAELDEAFAAAESAATPLKFSGGDLANHPDYDENPEGSGASRKTIIIVASVLAIAAIAAGIIILPSIGKNKDNGQGAEVAGNNGNVPTNNAAVPVETEAEKAARLAAEKETADKLKLAAEAKDLMGLITPPAGWLPRAGILHSRPLAVFFKPAAEKDKDGKEIFTENIMVTRDSLKGSGAVDLDDYYAKSRDAIKKDIPDYTPVSVRKVNLADQSPALLAGSSFTDKNPLRNMQLIAIKGDDVYVVTAVVLASNWAQERDMLGEAVMSFKYPSGQ